MSATIGNVGVFVEAGHINATTTPPSPLLGQQVQMTGTSVIFYITPDVAKQWLPVLTQIAEGE